MILQAERELVREYGVRMMQSHMTYSTMGNISIINREKGLFAISPHSVPYDAIRPEDVAVLDLDGNIVDGEKAPSMEHLLHRTLLLTHPDFGAVVHTHSIHAMAASCLMVEIPYICICSKHAGGPTLPCAPYAKAGSPELAKNVERAMRDHTAVLMQGHGMIGGGKNIEAAMNVCSNIETLCQIYLLSKAAGEPKIIA